MRPGRDRLTSTRMSTRRVSFDCVILYVEDGHTEGDTHINTAITIVVRSTEIDVNGHVNNAKYLEYLEWGREDWYEQHGFDYLTLKQMGLVTVVAHVEADFRREATQNDRLQITTGLVHVGNTSLRMVQQISNDTGDIVLDAQFVIVCVNPDSHQKVRVPQVIRALIEPLA